MRRCVSLTLAILFTISATAQSACPFSSAPEVSMSSNPLDELNNFFHGVYNATRLVLGQRARQNGPVLLIEGDNLVMLRNGTRTTVDVTPPLYTNTKIMDHMALCTFVLLTAQATGEPLSVDVKSNLTRLIDLSDAVAGVVPSTFPPSLVAIEMSLYKVVSGFQKSVLSSGSVTRAQLDAFTQSTLAYVQANVEQAAIAQLNAVHFQVLDWKAQMSTDEWENVHVGITGSHMAHKKELFLQYFTRLLATPIGLRVYYYEGSDEAGLLQLMGTHLIDEDASASFFNNPLRLHEDVLADATREYLDTLLPHH